MIAADEPSQAGEYPFAEVSGVVYLGEVIDQLERLLRKAFSDTYMAIPPGFATLAQCAICV